MLIRFFGSAYQEQAPDRHIYQAYASYTSHNRTVNI